MPRARKGIDYAPATRSADEIINAVRKAFEDLPPDKEVSDLDREAKVSAAVHHIVHGLSRATAHPPSWFRLAGRPVPTKRGAPRKIECEFIAFECAGHFKKITGRCATVQIDPETHKPIGAFYDLVVAVLAALAINTRAERAARSVQRNRRLERK